MAATETPAGKANASIRAALAHAACALMASTGVHAESSASTGQWDVSAAVLLYAEPDRVQALEPVINARLFLDTDESVNIRLTVDTLTGASGSGAVPSTRAQTFTRPSGNGSYVTAAGETPLDDTFHDDRVALAVTWNQTAFEGAQSKLGFTLSNEYDYQSIGTSATLLKNLNNSNTTWSTGVALAQDTVEPVGGTPLPFARMLAPGEGSFRTSASEQKTQMELITGMTQVIDAFSLFQFNVAASRTRGYLNDPYKILSVIDPIRGAPVFDHPTLLTLPSVVHENRPESRTRHSVFGRYKRFFDATGDVLDTSYRFMRDDWGVQSHTLDLRYRKTLTQRRFIQPHLRYYRQDAASFHTPFLLSGSVPPAGDTRQFATADYRLGKLSAYTVGLAYGQVNQQNSWSVALEYYLQISDEPGDKFGELSNLELYPDVDALMLRVLYDF